MSNEGSKRVSKVNLQIEILIECGLVLCVTGVVELSLLFEIVKNIVLYWPAIRVVN